MSRLCIASLDPSHVSLTYVRQHISGIRPGRTVVLAMNGDPSGLGVPGMNASRTRPGRAVSKLRSLSALVRTGHTGGLTPSQERDLDNFFSSHDVDTVFAEFGPTGCALRHYCRSRGLPLFVNFHGYDATVMPRSPLVRYAYRLLARDAAGIVCGSEHFRGILQALGFRPDRISVIPCGIDVEAFGPSPDRDPSRIVAVGRLTPKKAPHLMIGAFAIAARQHPELTLDVVGDGPMRGICEQVIADEGLTGRVILHGAQDNDFVRARMSEAGQFVQHSITAPNGDQESQGISLIEAMASSLPVVATDHNGFRETVIDGETGFLTPEGDVEAMAQRLIELAADGRLRERMGQAARMRAEAKFTAAIAADRLKTLLEPAPAHAPGPG